MYNKILMSFRFCMLAVCLPICFTSTTSCQNNKKHNSIHEQSELRNSIQGKLFNILLDDVQIFTEAGGQSMDSSEMFNSSLRIFSYINVSCATCLYEIKDWDSLAKSLMQYNTPIILYLQSKDRYEILKYLIEENRLAPFPYPFVLDINNNYFKQNNLLSEDKKLYTVLVDRDNTILWAGDPIHSENDQQKLTQIIADQSVVYASIN